MLLCCERLLRPLSPTLLLTPPPNGCIRLSDVVPRWPSMPLPSAYPFLSSLCLGVIERGQTLVSSTGTVQITLLLPCLSLILHTNILHTNILHTNIQHTIILHTNILHTSIQHTNILHTNIQHTNILHTNIQHTSILHTKHSTHQHSTHQHSTHQFLHTKCSAGTHEHAPVPFPLSYFFAPPPPPHPPHPSCLCV